MTDFSCPELLAPAGSYESLQAAVRCGADAVYVGARKFSARANAQNFDAESLKSGVEYCHLCGVKLYLAVNTLLFDDEFTALDDLIRLIADIGVDACIVQDFGVAAYIKQRIPSMPLHASTQMTIHTASGVKTAADMGFCRIVAARELSAEQLQEVCEAGRQYDVEVEVFVHGAHCMSVSGQCFLSACMGGRSANRGTCAQPCRLPFSATNQPAYALSLRDMCLIEHVDKLREMGVKSLKIEGRMKRPEYVAAAVSAYRTALDGGKPDLEELQAVFSRDGFTDGYFTKIRKNMFGMRCKDDVLASQKVLSSIRNRYQKERKCEQLNAHYVLKANEPVSLTVTDSAGRYITAFGAVAQIAQNHPTDLDILKKSFEKLGDTIYSAGKVTAELDGISMLNASELNAIRRAACVEMNAKRIDETKPLYQLSTVSDLIHNDTASTEKVRIRVQIRNFEQYRCLTEFQERIDAVLLPLHLAERYLASEQDILISKIILVPPRWISSEKILTALLETAKQHGFSKILVNHIGILELAKQLGFLMYGGIGLHATNCFALHTLYKLNLEDTLISPETPQRKAKELLSSYRNSGVLVYGRMPMMLTRNCPIKAQIGCLKCQHILKDRKKAQLYVDCSRYFEKPDYAEIFNSSPIWLADKKEFFDSASFALLYMTDESPNQIRNIINEYLENATPNAPSVFTRGIKLQLEKEKTP